MKLVNDWLRNFYLGVDFLWKMIIIFSQRWVYYVKKSIEFFSNCIYYNSN